MLTILLNISFSVYQRWLEYSGFYYSWILTTTTYDGWQ